MTHAPRIFLNARLFDGQRLHPPGTLHLADGRVARADAHTSVAGDGTTRDLAGDVLMPGYVDLQVNGGGGVMFNDDPSPRTLDIMARAHRGLGTNAILPTLITDTPDKTRAAIDAVISAQAAGISGVAGLHLEGPHLSLARRGAHEARLIRPMAAADLDQLIAAAAALPVLMVTLAPESVTEDQVSRLARAGVLVSLGHSDADHQTCRRYFAAGAGLATHLFNAMRPLASREPGLVGAALSAPGVSAGLIADGVHVHPDTMAIAWAAKSGPGRLFLVSDAMAVAGTDQTEFTLGGRVIRRSNGRLTLADGTLAGADMDLTLAIRTLVRRCHISLEDALQAAITHPANLIGRPDLARPGPGNLFRLSADLGSIRECGPN